VSADLAVLISDPASVERFADPGEYIVQCCERGRDWLKAALERDDLEAVLECKAQAEAVRVYTVSRGYGEDAKVSAEEIIRRAERGLAQATRKGQERGEIRTRADGGWDARNLDSPAANKKSPTGLVGCGQARSDAYAMADDLTDDEFEEVITEGRAERNMSRANLARKARDRRGREPGELAAGIARLAARGLNSAQIAGELGVTEQYARRLARRHGIQIKADEVTGRARRLDSNRIVGETATALEGLAMGVTLIDLVDLDPAEIKGWAASLTESLRALNRLAKQMREMAQQ
jgi:hypothetical protein